MTTTKTKDKMFIFAHMDEEQQRDFIAEAHGQELFAEAVPFMIFQLPENTGETVPEDELKKYRNGSRPYFTISKANPDHIGNYYNWNYLEVIIQKGWKQWLSA